MNVHDLPTLNALLNGLSGVWLILGLVFIRQGNRDAHRKAMLGALVTSTLFLVSYLIYHAFAGSNRFDTEGGWRTLYLGILLTHTVLAVVILPLVLVTVARALRSNFEGHKRIARWTWPLWMYVSVTGVVIYLMLYHLDPALQRAG